MKVCVFVAALLCFATAAYGGVYKWTDESGKVHYGDKAAAPNSSTQMDIGKKDKPVPEPTMQDRLKNTRPTPPMKPAAQSPMEIPKSRDIDLAETADPASVSPRCKGIVDRILAASNERVPWKHLADQYQAECPTITWACREYRKRPADNTCRWVTRASGDSIIITKTTD